MNQQRTEEWFNDRLGIPTASRFSDVMTVIKSGESAARRNYRAQLVAERLTSQKAETFTSQAMQWGIDTEPLARLRYTLKTGNAVEEVGFVRHATIAAGASPDGYVGTDGGVEFKCPETATHIQTLLTKKVPGQYYAQVQGGMCASGRKWWDFVSFDPRLPENAQLIILRVPRDEDYIRALEAELILFNKEVDKETEFVRGYHEI